MPVTAERQPALHRLVGDAATRLGLPMPPAIRLGPDVTVAGVTGPRGTGLVIGLPVAYAFGHAELSALVEHEIAVLAAAPAGRAARRYRRWARAMDTVALYEPGERLPRLAAATVRRYGPEAEPVERAADQACGSRAAAALIRRSRLQDDFTEFGFTVERALTRLGSLRYRITDLHDGWRRRLAAGAGPLEEDIDRDEVDMMGRRHPFLHAAAQSLIGQPPVPYPPADPVEVAPLTRGEQRRLSSTILSDGGRYVPWRTFATVPPRIWQRAAAREARRTLAAVARVLGRPATGPAEAADVIRARPAAVADAPVEDLDIPVFQQMSWLDLLDDALLRHGWVRAHPAVPGVFCAPDGTRLDGRDLTRRAAADPFAYAELRRLLATTPTP